MDMRDKIAVAILTASQSKDRSLTRIETADAIMAEMPAMLMDMIPDLVWVGEAPDDFLSESVMGEFCVYLCRQHGWLVYIDGHDDGWVQYPSEDDGFETPEEAKAAANAHHKEQLTKAMGWTV